MSSIITPSISGKRTITDAEITPEKNSPKYTKLESGSSKTETVSSPLVHSPMNYHYYDGLPTKAKELKKFEGKALCTFSTPSTKDQVEVLKRNWKKIEQMVLTLQKDDKESIEFEDLDANVKVHKNGEISVSQNGTVRTFKVHEMELKTGKARKRLFPVKGTKVSTITGAEFKALRLEYQQLADSKISLGEFIKQRIASAKAVITK